MKTKSFGQRSLSSTGPAQWNYIINYIIKYNQWNCINDLINECNIDIKSVPVLPTSPQMPQWEHMNAKFDTDLKKSESRNILTTEVREL